MMSMTSICHEHLVPLARLPVVIRRHLNQPVLLSFTQGVAVVVKHDCVVNVRPREPVLCLEALDHELERLPCRKIRVPVLMDIV